MVAPYVQLLLIPLLLFLLLLLPAFGQGLSSPEALCSGKLDTIVTTANGETYAFLGDKYWKLKDYSVEPGYPRSIAADWDGLPDNLDASFTFKTKKTQRTYFFKGSLYWRFSEMENFLYYGKMDAGYPKQIDKGFPGIPSNVDAAFVWSSDDKIYFFKETNYWKFDPERKPHVDSSYPKPLSNWDGIPENLDSALQWTDGKSYFFKDGRYYRFDDMNFTLDTSVTPSFPRYTGSWWFGCQTNSDVCSKMFEDFPNKLDDSVICKRVEAEAELRGDWLRANRDLCEESRDFVNNFMSKSCWDFWCGFAATQIAVWSEEANSSGDGGCHGIEDRVESVQTRKKCNTVKNKLKATEYFHCRK